MNLLDIISVNKVKKQMKKQKSKERELLKENIRLENILIKSPLKEYEEDYTYIFTFSGIKEELTRYLDYIIKKYNLNENEYIKTLKTDESISVLKIEILNKIKGKEMIFEEQLKKMEAPLYFNRKEELEDKQKKYNNEIYEVGNYIDQKIIFDFIRKYLRNKNYSQNKINEKITNIKKDNESINQILVSLDEKDNETNTDNTIFKDYEKEIKLLEELNFRFECYVEEELSTIKKIEDRFPSLSIEQKRLIYSPLCFSDVNKDGKSKLKIKSSHLCLPYFIAKTIAEDIANYKVELDDINKAILIGITKDRNKAVEYLTDKYEKELKVQNEPSKEEDKNDE